MYTIQCLPQTGSSIGYDETLSFEMKLTANDALNLVKNLYYQDTAGEEILWTDEIKENHVKLLHGEMPEQYFENEKGRLRYGGLRPY